MADRTKFWNRIAKKYAASPVANEAAYEHKLDKTRDYLNADMLVLEVGCGTGTTALKHAPYVKQIVATDFSTRMIEIARGKAQSGAVDNVDFRCESLDSLTTHSEHYDMIMAHSVLHLLENRTQSLSLIYEQLKPGGVFVSSTACINDMMSWFRFIAPIARAIRVIPYVSCFGKQTLLAEMAEAGFQIEYQWQADNKAALFVIARKP